MSWLDAAVLDLQILDAVAEKVYIPDLIFSVDGITVGEGPVLSNLFSALHKRLK